MDTRLIAVGGALVLLAGVAVVNSHRAAQDRLSAQPAPVVSTPSPEPSLDPTTVLCDSWPGHGTTDEAEQTYQAAGHPYLRVSSTRCANTSGERYPSLVHVIDIDDDQRITATLIRPTEHLYVLSLSVAGPTISVTAQQALGSAPAAPAFAFSGPEPGSVFTLRFTSTDGEHFTRSARIPVASPCHAADLRLAAGPKPTAHPDVADRAAPSATVLLMHNVSNQPCALEGYPQVSAVSTAGERLSARPQLFGPNGGVLGSSAPPVVVLAASAGSRGTRSGGTASATVDSADGTPAGGTALCNTLQGVSVALPDGEPLGTAAVAVRVCDFQVHPLVSGTSGTLW